MVYSVTLMRKTLQKLYMLKIHIHIGNILVKKQRNIGIVPIQVMS